MNVKKEDVRMTYDEFVKEVMQDPQKSLPFDLRDVSYEQAKDYLMVDVCNEKMNREDLCEMPHERKGDLALRYLLFWKEPESNVRISILVNDTLFRKWGIEETTLKQDAWENMKKKMPSVARDAKEVIIEKMGPTGKESDIFEGEQIPLYFLTNMEFFRGASYMLDEETMSGLAELYEDDLVILPSSIHEVLFMRKQDTHDIDILADIVMEMNETQIPPEEILSDNVYIFSKETHRLSVISAEITMA